MKKYLISIILCISILASIFAFSSCAHGEINSDTETQSESPKTAMLFLDLNGGSLRQDEEKLYEYESGEKVRYLPTPTKSGYIFAGWYNAYTNKRFESPFVIEENTTLYAKWTPDDVIVTIDTNGGMIKNWSTEFEWSPGDSLDLGDPTKEGFEFVGWEVNGEKVEFPYTITEDITFVATWKKIPQPVKITFNLNGGTMDSEKTVEYESGTRVTSLPTPTKNGATFLGWYNLAQDDEAASTAKIVIIPFKVTEDIEIHAWWLTLPGSTDTDTETVTDTETETNALEIGAAVGNLCPSLELSVFDETGFTNEKIDPSKTKKVTVINFWYTACQSCVAEMPYFEKMTTIYGDSIKIITIHSTDPCFKDAFAFVENNYPNSNIVFAQDISGETIDEYYKSLGGSKYAVYPMTVILDSNGVISYTKLGSISEYILKNEIDNALNN